MTERLTRSLTAREEIQQLLKQYFDALYRGDLQSLSQVFHNKAYYCYLQNQQLVHWNMSTYFDAFQKRVHPFENTQRRQDEILSIDVAGPSVALAKVKCAIHEKLCTDFLSLIKQGKRWKIIGKVFHYEVITEH